MAITKRHVTENDGCVWITGASTGIGRALALRLAREGWTVAATARSTEGLKSQEREAIKLKGSITPHMGDISDRAQITKVVGEIESAHGPIALAILNAGIYLPVETANLELDRFEKSVDVNLKGTAYCLAPLITKMKDRGRGHIAIVSSVTGYGGLPTSFAYGATKAALINMAECMEIELAGYGIRTTIINPGFVDTPAQDDLDFPKPFMVSANTAAKRIVAGLKKDKFEITFPRRFTYLLKVLNNFFPKDIYLNLIRKQTGRSKAN
jgi:NAD(P)-dependent dehydrogenase (short-subunit alcohol dehydrogenase family)